MSNKPDTSTDSAQVEREIARGESIERLARTFESSARRWEIVVYPALLAFVVLAIYGFYLVYHLSRDVSRLADSVGSNMTTLSTHMRDVSDNVRSMTGTMRVVATSMTDISDDVGALQPMLTKMQTITDNMGNLNQSIARMTNATQFMQVDMARMNHSVGKIGRPMSMFNAFMPW